MVTLARAPRPILPYAFRRAVVGAIFFVTAIRVLAPVAHEAIVAIARARPFDTRSDSLAVVAVLLVVA